MSVAAFLAELRSHDVAVWPEGNELRCNAPAGVLTAGLRDQLRERKAEIVRFLRAAERTAKQDRAIVPLQPLGRRTPIFAIGGHNGDVFCYRTLAQYLGRDQPFFGLRPPGLDAESEPLTSLTDLAAHFAARIVEVRPENPVIVAGYCAGGAIAFELALALLRQGRCIEFVALFAGRYPTWFRPLPQLRQRVVYYTDRIEMHTRALASLPSGERRPYLTGVLRRLSVRHDVAPAQPEDAALASLAKVQTATMTAIRAYRPTYFPGRLVLFLPSAKARRSADGLLRWRGFARQVDEYCGPQGCDGDSMLLEPHVGAIAGLVRHCCDRSPAD